jgi:hypothetical protein
MERCDDARSRKIDDPNNSKHHNDRSDAEAEHESNIMPGHALSSLPRWYDRAPFRTLGRTHSVLLISDADCAFSATVRPIAGSGSSLSAASLIIEHD